MRKLRPRGAWGFAQGCTLLRYVLLKSPDCSQSSKELNIVLLISLFSTKPVYCTLWISVEIRKGFLFLYIPPGPFKGKGEHVCKYICKYLFSKMKSSSDRWWSMQQEINLSLGSHGYSFSSVCFNCETLHYNASVFLLVVRAPPVGKQQSSCSQRILKAYFLQLADTFNAATVVVEDFARCF